MKKILAYSTVSQLGFMFAAVGVGFFAAGFFHVFTHAFFKACLFLGAGSVMHAVHAHGDADIFKLGGLKKIIADHPLDLPGELLGHRRLPAHERLLLERRDPPRCGRSDLPPRRCAPTRGRLVHPHRPHAWPP